MVAFLFFFFFFFFWGGGERGGEKRRGILRNWEKARKGKSRVSTWNFEYEEGRREKNEIKRVSRLREREGGGEMRVSHSDLIK